LLRSQCDDRNYLQFSPIFGKKLAFFLKTYVMIQFWKKTLKQKTAIIGENIIKIITSFPDVNVMIKNLAE
jgi:hypothetical protein